MSIFNWKLQAAIGLAEELEGDDNLQWIVLRLGAELLKRGVPLPSEGAMRQHLASEEVFGLGIDEGDNDDEELRRYLVEAWEKWQVPEEERAWCAGLFDVTPRTLQSQQVAHDEDWLDDEAEN